METMHCAIIFCAETLVLKSPEFHQTLTKYLLLIIVPCSHQSRHKSPLARKEGTLFGQQPRKEKTLCVFSQGFSQKPCAYLQVTNHGISVFKRKLITITL